MPSYDLASYPIHLGLGVTTEIEAEFTGNMEWYADYSQRHEADGKEGRLIGLHTFTKNWDVWEMHPHGSEVVFCMGGFIYLHQEQDDGEIVTVGLASGEYAINPTGIWHTADVDDETTALFITAGLGTQHKPRA